MNAQDAIRRQQQIVVCKANLVVYYSPIMQDSITFLDLSICEYSLFLGRSLEENRKWSFLWKTFIRSKGDGKREWFDRSRVMYRLHLDTPNYVAGRTRRHSGNFMEQPLDLIPSRMVHDNKNFLEHVLDEIISIVTKDGQRPRCIQKHLRPVAILFREHDSCRQRLWRFFLDILFRECSNTGIVEEFVDSMPFWLWVLDEEEVVLEYLLHHAGQHILSGLETHLDDDLINNLIFNRGFRIVPLIFKYRDTPHYDTDKNTYTNTITRVAALFNVDARDLTQPVAASLLTSRRHFQLVQLFKIYMESNLEPQPGDENPNLATRALDLVWKSVPDPYISLDEMITVYGELLGVDTLQQVHSFYNDAVGNHDYVVRPLQWLCRMTTRRRINENGLLPDGIDELNVPALAKDFLKLNI